MNKLSRTWKMMGASWEILKKDKEMLIFTLLSSICCIAVIASFALPLYSSGDWQPPKKDAAPEEQVMYYSILFLFYFCNYFVIIFFNSAIIACAAIRIGGGDPTLADGFKAALNRLPLIFGWALLAASVGLILRIIEDRSEKVGRFVAGLLGMAWSVVSYLVIPVMVIERKGPVAALKESTAMLKKTWGEQLVGNFSFGLVFFLLNIPAILLIVLGVFTGSGTAAVVCIGIAVIYLILTALIQSTLQAIFQTLVYLYASQGRAPEGIHPDLLINAMKRK